jgi:anti-sigma B factor antagonist
MWIQPDGELDYETADVVQRTVMHCLEAGFSRIVIDLRKVTFMDSSGLRVLIEARRAAAERKIGLSVAPGPPGVQRVLKMTGTAALFAAPSTGPDGPAPA